MKIGFIGYGRMGSALAKGALKAGVFSGKNVTVIDSKAALRAQAKRDGFRSTSELSKVLEASSIVFICVKPQGMRELFDELKSLNRGFGSTCFVSIAAGVRLSELEKGLGKKVAVIRAMPNTPALLQAGITGLSRGRWTSTSQGAFVEKIFKAVGGVVWITESKMDAVTAVSGSGPAYAFYLAEALVSTARKFGFTASQARTLVHQTLFGAGCMLSQRPESAEELRQQVTSPGGTTEAALREFEKQGLKKIVQQALTKAQRRSKELSRTISLS